MHYPKGGVAVLYVMNYYPYRKEVIDLVEGLLLIHHLFVDRKEVLCPAVDLGFYSGFFHRLFDLFFLGINDS